MKSKYNTGVPIDINELSEEERKIAFHEWAEGSEALEQLLNEGYERGFLSHACCGGDTGKPYIEYTLNDEYSRKMAIGIAEQLINSDLDCDVTIYSNFFLNEVDPKQYPTRDIIALNVEAKMDNKEAVFETMSKAVRETQIDDIKLPEKEEEIPTKNFKKNIKENDTQNLTEQKAQQQTTEEKVDNSSKGKKMIDDVVEGSKKDMTRGEINSSIVEIKQTEKTHIQQQTNSQPSMGDELSI